LAPSLATAGYEVRPFTPADYVAAIGDGWCISTPRQVGELFAATGPAYTALVDGEVAAVAGIAVMWPGVAEAWAVLTAVGRAHPAFVHRAVARTLRGLVRQLGLRRLQASVDASNPVALRWAEVLGFRPEGVMRAYGPQGQDFVRFAMFPGGLA
jgi:hypothetical protein